MFKRIQFILLFLFLLAFRTLFGLSLQFFGPSEPEKDALQTYLIGLKFYTTGSWPYYGPDQYLLTRNFHTQIPGALEGLVIGLPFHILPLPEAPFLLLNLLSLSTIALFSLYIVRRLPDLSFNFVFIWIALLPWTLNHGTNVYNVSYILFSSILFFMGFFESIPGFSLDWVHPSLAFGLMGFGIFWNMQFHQSWILFIPLAVMAFAWRRKTEIATMNEEIRGFLAGSLLPLVFLAPTLVRFGFNHAPSGITQSIRWLNWENVLAFFTILARYLSLGAYEIPRFLGGGTSERLHFLREAPWLYPPALFLFAVGILQPFMLLSAGWWPDKRRQGEARLVYLIMMGAFLWTWFCFWFTTTGPSAHMYYLFLPLIVFYSFYVWSRFHSRAWKIMGILCLIASLWLQTGILVQRFKERSFWADRGLAAKAIDQKDYRVLGQRRNGSFY